MGFSPADKDLVEIVEAVGAITMASHKRGIKSEGGLYIDSLVKNYVYKYYSNNNVMPRPSLFREAINWYATENLRDEPISLSKTIKGIVGKVILQSLDRSKKQLRNDIRDGSCGQNPNVALC